jgi:hypothetical protein
MTGRAIGFSCSYAAVWLSRIPTLIPGHFVSIRAVQAAIFVPSLGSSLERVRLGDGETFRVFADHFEDCLKRRPTIEPAAMHSLVHIIVFAKEHSS